MFSEHTVRSAEKNERFNFPEINLIDFIKQVNMDEEKLRGK